MSKQNEFPANVDKPERLFPIKDRILLGSQKAQDTLI